MTHNTNTYTLRSLAFQTDRDVAALKKNYKFRDLVTAGSLLNAILFAVNRNVPYGLAKFAKQTTITGDILFLTGGILFRAISFCGHMAAKYKGAGYVLDMEDVFESFTKWQPPEVIVDMRAWGLFNLYTTPDAAGVVREPKTNGYDQLFQDKPRHIHGLPIAKFAALDTISPAGQLGLEGDLHVSVESVVNAISEDVVLSLESFITGMAKELGMRPLASSRSASA